MLIYQIQLSAQIHLNIEIYQIFKSLDLVIVKFFYSSVWFMGQFKISETFSKTKNINQSFT